MAGRPIRERVHLYRQDDELGQWTVATCDPAIALRPYVAALWFGAGNVGYQRDRILPSGGSHILINLGPTQYRVNPVTGERIPFDDAWYAGLHRSPIDTEAPGGTALLGVQLHATGARPLFGVDAVELSDRVTPMADFVGDEIRMLRDRLLDAPQIIRRFAILEEWLLGRLEEGPPSHPVVDWTVDRIVRSGGQVSIEAMARETGVSRMHFARLFRQQVGLAPKSLARVHRFRGAVRMLSGQPVPWAEFAAHCGYFDQSHLIHDFQEFSGLTPGAFSRHTMADAITLVIR